MGNNAVGKLSRNAAIVLALTCLAGIPSAQASADGLCAQQGGNWDGGTCSTVIKSRSGAEMALAIGIPPSMIDLPDVQDYYQRLFSGWRATGETTPRDSSARADYQIVPGPGGLQTLVVHEVFEPFGMQANNAFRTFAYAGGRRMQLADLFAPGVDPLAAITAAAGPYLEPALNNAAPPHAPGTYPFTPEEFTPGPNGPGYSSDYRGFVLGTDELTLYLPNAPMTHENPAPHDRMPWSMDGGAVQVHIPLSALAGQLRPQFGG